MWISVPALVGLLEAIRAEAEHKTSKPQASSSLGFCLNHICPCLHDMAALSGFARSLRSPAVLRHFASLHRAGPRIHPITHHYLSYPCPVAYPSNNRFLFAGIAGSAVLIGLGLDRSNGQNIVLSKNSVPSDTELDNEEIRNEQLKEKIIEVAKIKEEKVSKGEYTPPSQEVMDLPKEKGNSFGEEALHTLMEVLDKVRELEKKIMLLEMEKDNIGLSEERDRFEKEKEPHWEDVRNRHKAIDEERKRLDDERASKIKKGRCLLASILKSLEKIFGFPGRLMKLKTTIEEGTVLVTAVYMSLPTVLVLNQIMKEKKQEFLEKASSLGVQLRAAIYWPSVPSSSTTSSHLPASPSSSVVVDLPVTPPSASADNVEDVGDDEDENNE